MVALDRDIWEGFVGLPFRHRGRGPDTYDCYGLVMAIYHKLGVELSEVGYGFRPSEQTIVLDNERNVAESTGERGWHPCELHPGAVILFRDPRGGAAHVGIAIDEDRFIHASYEHAQVLISRLSRTNNYYKKKILGIYEYAV